MYQEAIELLEGHYVVFFSDDIGRDFVRIPREDYNKALKSLKQQPAVGGLTTEIRNALKTQTRLNPKQEEKAIIICDRLDRAASTNKDLLEACKFAKAQIKKGAQKKALPVLRAVISKAKKEAK